MILPQSTAPPPTAPPPVMNTHEPLLEEATSDDKEGSERRAKLEESPQTRWEGKALG